MNGIASGGCDSCNGRRIPANLFGSCMGVQSLLA